MDPTAGDRSVILWDRRVRVFVSSTLEELAEERAAVRAAITRLRLTPVMFELGARAHPPRELYRSYLEQSDVFVGIYGDRYGWIAPDSDISGLEDEYLLSGDRPKLLYVRTPAPDREPRLAELIERIWAGSGASTAPYRGAADLHERVADDLAVLLTERFRSTAVVGTLDPVPLPHPTTPLIGREGELARLGDLLRSGGARLVTILGPGGVGKTRLALAAADSVRDSVDTVCFVDLAPVRDPGGVLPAVAAALRVGAAARPVRDVLVDVLAGHRVLLVLDNMEHVIGAAGVVADLLAACPDLQVLVSSRTVLHLHGEQELPLEPLPVPDGRARGAGHVATAPAVELFVSRAAQVRPGFVLTDDNAADVARVVRRLEGIPLALELAAARLRLLPLRGLLLGRGSELDLSSPDVDTPLRQQTLRATISWSYELLAPEDQALMNCLSVFASGWTLSAAAAVGAAGSDVASGVSRLMEHSLVSVDFDAPGEPRFQMLQSVRAFAHERLAESGGYDAAMRRLASYGVRLAAEAGAGLRTGGSRTWRARVDAELGTVRAILAWAVETDDAALAVRLTAPLTRYWWSRGMLVEMLRLAEQVAELPSAELLEPGEAAVLLWCRGTIRVATGDSDGARALLGQAVEDARRRDDEAALAQALFGAALTTREDEPDTARRLLLESAAIFERTDDHWGLALTLVPLGDLDLLAGRIAEARALHDRALDAAETIDDDHMRALVLDQLAADALLVGDQVEAARRLGDAAAIHLELHDDEGVANCLTGYAALALATGSASLAARYLGAADRVRRIAGVVVWPFLRPLSTQLDQAVAGSLSPEELARERAAGDDWDGLRALAAARAAALAKPG